jgi:hypothetical protein
MLLDRPRGAAARVLVVTLALLSGCYALRPPSAGGQTDFRGPRDINPQDVALRAGYRIEPAFSSATIDDRALDDLLAFVAALRRHGD